MEPRAPSGLFPSRPHRPSFREPHPIRISAVVMGVGSAALWLLLVGLLATSAAAYIWLTLVASAAAWLGAAVLIRFGDRGVAVGVGLATSVGVSAAVVLVIQQWITSGWPLW